LRKCQACGEPLPEGSRSTRKFCDATCRYHKFLAKKPRQTIPNDLRFYILRRDGFRCRYCGATPVKDGDGQPATRELFVDHVISVEDGGDLTNEANLITACSPCNQGKGRLSLDPAEIPA
jgi:5-methylcytosine-specific restriction endonuclease McrA